ncbi:hypothetical protein F2Q70_00044691 [Brassica cretica]|uniref:Uncharacterized protein n=1 Tax=Brassica cretica TaxID=69181 RepID=A0A8S9KKA0_BRACR|nr:hypothetical protein F2Q70_00044691 [Brassica cretica]KAF2606177.1 hypothetical protein F2Q68_00045640 [Brassica cretica]
MALNLSIYGAGNFLSSFMISVIDRVTCQSGQTSWFDNDLNKAHLDYFYWLLLASLSLTGLAFYLWFTKSLRSSRRSFRLLVPVNTSSFGGPPALGSIDTDDVSQSKLVNGSLYKEKILSWWFDSRSSLRFFFPGVLFPVCSGGSTGSCSGDDLLAVKTTV